MSKGTLLKSSIARDRILKWIREGQFAPGYRIPAEPMLARTLKLHLSTVRRGLAELQEQGLIEKRARVGNFVKAGMPSLVQNQIAVVLHKWSSDDAPHRAFASLAMAELDSVIDRETHSMTMLTYSGQLLEGPNTPVSVILRNDIKNVLLYPRDSSDQLPAVRKLLDAGVKVVLLTHATTWDSLGLFSVKYDEEGALRQIFRKLVELGHRCIAVALDADWSVGFRDLYCGCIRSLFKEYDLGTPDRLMIYPKWDPVARVRESDCLQPLFDAEVPPSAVVVPDETFAMGVWRFCYRRGLRIPDDLSLASAQDLSPHSHSIEVSSPRTDLLVKQGVRAAAKHLLAWMEGHRPAEREISLRCDVSWTDSIGPVPTTGRRSGR